MSEEGSSQYQPGSDSSSLEETGVTADIGDTGVKDDYFISETAEKSTNWTRIWRIMLYVLLIALMTLQFIGAVIYMFKTSHIEYTNLTKWLRMIIVSSMINIIFIGGLIVSENRCEQVLKKSVMDWAVCFIFLAGSIINTVALSEIKGIMSNLENNATGPTSGDYTFAADFTTNYPMFGGIVYGTMIISGVLLIGRIVHAFTHWSMNAAERAKFYKELNKIRETNRQSAIRAKKSLLNAISAKKRLLETRKRAKKAIDETNYGEEVATEKTKYNATREEMEHERKTIDRTIEEDTGIDVTVNKPAFQQNGDNLRKAGIGQPTYAALQSTNQARI